MSVEWKSTDDGHRIRVALLGPDWDAFAAPLRARGTDAVRLERWEEPGRPTPDVIVVRSDGAADLAHYCSRVRTAHPGAGVVAFPGTKSGTDIGVADAITALRAGADDFVAHPGEVNELVEAIWRVVRLKELRRNLRALHHWTASDTEPFSEIIGESRPIRTLKEQLLPLTGSDATVLLVGESGTGKEVVARALHRHGPRARGPFVAINCAAVPARLMDSEFFGHAKGAFTGAVSASAGLLSAAHGGTLLLDEVAAMPLSLQAKLVRALQERCVRPVGEASERPFEARIIAASNVDLAQEVQNHAFREDLFYRLNVIQLPLPPLRERGSDVLLLAQHFLRRAAKTWKKPVVGLSPAAASRLLAHGWPGNVRELENCIEAAVARCHFDHIADDDIPEHIGRTARSDRAQLRALEDVEHEHIARVLSEVGGNKSEAARLLGISRKTLYRKLAMARP
jgi:two-component system, NtrC family, response regulator AtoC